MPRKYKTQEDDGEVRTSDGPGGGTQRIRYNYRGGECLVGFTYV